MQHKLLFLLRNSTISNCTELYQVTPVAATTIVTHLGLIFGGLASNILLHFVFSGRAKLGTACFAYIRIIGIFQFIFFVLPFPLKVLTDHYQGGRTWIAANFLPVFLALFHFVISSLCLCFVIRLLLLLNYIRRCRRWSSETWVAWRKIFCILPFGTIANVSLCFEYIIDYEECMFGDNIYAIGRARLSEAAREDHIRMDYIRAVPTFIFWLCMICTITYLVSERCILPKLGSPYSAKHIPLFSNLLPLLIALLLSHGVVHFYTTYNMIYDIPIEEPMRLTLYGVSYCLPFPLMVLFSRTFRSHMFHLMTNILQGRSKVRKDSKLRKMTQQLTRSVAFSKLEMENSEFDDRLLGIPRNSSVRSAQREDVGYRVRFALPDDDNEPGITIHSFPT